MNSDKLYERISTDIFGPFQYYTPIPNSEKRTGYILTITDIYSRETQLVFHKQIKTQEFIDAVEYWISSRAKPKHLISDNGRQYTSTDFTNYLTDMDINHILIPTYTPRSNGISERINQTITFIISINKYRNIYDTVKEAENTLNNNYNRGIELHLSLNAQKGFLRYRK